MNAEDLLKLDDGRAASAADFWAADLSAGEVAPTALQVDLRSGHPDRVCLLTHKICICVWERSLLPAPVAPLPRTP